MEKPPDAKEMLEQAVQRHADGLTRYASRICGNVELGRDVVQETLLALWKTPAGDVEGHVVEWLYTVCRRKALDVRRKEGRHMRISETAEATLQSASRPPDEVIESRDLATRAQQLVGNLSENQQEALRLKFQHGLSYKQIATVMGISESNVGFMLHVAIKTVREKLQMKEANHATR